MLGLAKLALGPVLLWQGRRVRATALRLPEAPGARTGMELAGEDRGDGGDGDVGAEPDWRIVFVGDSSCAGVGLPSQDASLPRLTAQALAHQLSLYSTSSVSQFGAPQASVAWTSVARSGVCSAEALMLWSEAHKAAVSASTAAPMHISLPGVPTVAVIVLGVNDVTAQRSPRAFVQNLQTLIAAVKRDTGAVRVVCCAVPPMDQFPALPQPLRWYLGQCSRRLDRALQSLCTTQDGWSYCGIGWSEPGDAMAEDGYHPGPVQVRRWAQALADGILQACSLPKRL